MIVKSESKIFFTFTRMTLEEYLRIRKLLTTTTEGLKLEKLTQSEQINVNPNNFQIVNTLTVQQNIIISILLISSGFEWIFSTLFLIF